MLKQQKDKKAIVCYMLKQKDNKEQFVICLNNRKNR